jgi:hypothetical protein
MLWTVTVGERLKKKIVPNFKTSHALPYAMAEKPTTMTRHPEAIF